MPTASLCSRAQQRTWTRRRDDALEFAANADARAAQARVDALNYASDVGREMATRRAEDEDLTAAHYRTQAAQWSAVVARSTGGGSP